MLQNEIILKCPVVAVVLIKCHCTVCTARTLRARFHC